MTLHGCMDKQQQKVRHIAKEFSRFKQTTLSSPLSKSGKELLVLFYILYPYYYRSCLGKQRSKTIYLHRTTVAHIFTLCMIMHMIKIHTEYIVYGCMHYLCTTFSFCKIVSALCTCSLCAVSDHDHIYLS